MYLFPARDKCKNFLPQLLRKVKVSRIPIRFFDLPPSSIDLPHYVFLKPVNIFDLLLLTRLKLVKSSTSISTNKKIFLWCHV